MHAESEHTIYAVVTIRIKKGRGGGVMRCWVSPPENEEEKVRKTCCSTTACVLTVLQYS